MSKPNPQEPKPSPDERAASPRTNPALPTGGLRRVTVTPSTTVGEFGFSEPPQSQAPTVAPPPEAEIDAYLGATIDGRYLVEKQLGEGGMGVVYLCRHTIIDKKVAMKVLRADMARNEEVTERFLNEARSASSIGNPHIIDISDFGRLPDGATYFVMEFLSGTPMAELADAGLALDPDRVGHIGIQLTQGLAAAHEAGIVHRDLKPDNIFLVKQGSQEDFVKILDFGIAKANSSTSKLTQAGQVFGTPHYMSPEQAAGAEVDHRSDIYALGIILYELSTGTLPFDADNFMAILTQHMYKAPLPPSQIEALPHALPEGLEMIILKCMAKEPVDRFQTMTEVGDQLRQVFTGGLQISAREMRSIADGFASAEDFFAKTGGRASQLGLPPESAPREKKSPNLPIYIGLGLAAALATGAAIWSFSSSPSVEAQAIVVQEPTLEANPVETPPVENETKEEAPAVTMTEVVVAADPADAHVFQGEEDLGKSPVVVSVGDESVELTIRKVGYKTKELTLDGSKKVESVSLEKQPRTVRPSPSPTQRRSPKPASKPKLGDDGLVNPWD